MVLKEADEFAKKIWEYHQLHQPLEQADMLLVLGSNDIRVADYAAQLYHEDWAPLIVFTGGIAHKGDLLETPWDIPEAEVFVTRAREHGVPNEAMLLETTSTNTGDNFRFARVLLEERTVRFKKVIVVQKPSMERRAYATGKILWPDVALIVTSPTISYEEYPNDVISKEDFINIMVGDLQRIKEYPARGWQIPQEIPDDVWAAYEQLVAMGFTKHML